MLTRCAAGGGGLLWLGWVFWAVPSPFDIGWGQALLLLAPLLLVPMGMHLLEPRHDSAALWRWAKYLQFPAAALLAAAHLLPRGHLAAALAMPWFAVTSLLGLAGAIAIWRRGAAPVSKLCLDAAPVFLTVGAAWAVADRLGYRPLEFETPIVLLTAIHFHYAGFVLPLVTGLALDRLGHFSASWAGVGVLTGVPLVAVGITTSQLGFGPGVETFASLWLALCGLGVAWLHLRLTAQSDQPIFVRFLDGLSALALAGGMILASLYGVRFFMPVDWLDLPWMRALHGTANALGFGLAGLLGWILRSGAALVRH